MLSLVPAHTYDPEQLFKFIIKRNELFIRLRYFASAGIGIFIIVCYFFLNINFSKVQLFALLLINFVILGYNILFNILIETEVIQYNFKGFNPLHFSLIQIFLDLICLFFLTYYTGSLESPFLTFFVLHMIIGSLILPGYVIYSLAGLIIIGFSVLSVLEYSSLILHHNITGLIDFNLYNNQYYIIILLSSFSLMLLVSVFLPNLIARAWYVREQELNIALKKINEAEKIKQKYTIGIVHEIKTPVVAVQSYLDIVLQKYTGPISATVEEKLSRARVRTDEAIQIINDVLSISKIKLSEKLQKTPLNISEIVEKIITKRKVQAELNNQSLHFYDLRHDKSYINGDKYLLELALSNLIGNALKYTNSGGTIEVVLDNCKPPRNLSVEVCDNGIGIPESDKEKIFSEFYRASNVKQKNFEGTGLGLAVVKQIVEQHGGIMIFESPSRLANNIGKGTSFKIFMPSK